MKQWTLPCSRSPQRAGGSPSHISVAPQRNSPTCGRSVHAAPSHNRLGFTPEDFYAGIRVGASVIHVKLVDTVDPSIAFAAAGDHLHLYFMAANVEAAAPRLLSHGVQLRTDVTDTPWGTRELSVADPGGHILYVGQAVP